MTVLTVGVVAVVITAGAAAPVVAGGAAAAAGTTAAGGAAVAGATTGVVMTAAGGTAATGAAVAGSAGAGAVVGAVTGAAVGGTAAAAGTGAATGAAAAAAVTSSSAGSAAVTAGILSGPVGWLVLGSEMTDSVTHGQGYTLDCWKPVFHDESTELSTGKLLRDVLLDSRIKSVQSEIVSHNALPNIVLRNVWDEQFVIEYVTLPNGIPTAHAKLVN